MAHDCLECAGQGCAGCANLPLFDPETRILEGYSECCQKDRPIWEMVIEDMRARHELGKQRYGKPLLANDDMDKLQSAYEEALGLCSYLKGELVERELRRNVIDVIGDR